MVIQNVTLNGFTGFSAFGRSYQWQDKHLEAAHFNNQPPAGTSTIKVSITGSNWIAERLHFQSQSQTEVLTTVITDTDSGADRSIKRMMLAGYGTTTISLLTTRIGYLEDGEQATVKLTLGSAELRFADLWATASLTVNMGSGTVKSMLMSDHGTNVFTGASGYLGYLEMGDGTNTFIGGSSEFGTIRAYGALNTMTFQNGGDVVWLGEGKNNVTVNGGQINSMRANGDDTITLHGDARILQLKMDDGVNRLTTEDGNIESIYAYGGKNTINLGMGGAQQIVLSGSAAAQVISSVGWLGSLQIYAGDQINVQSATVTVGIGGAGYLQTSKGADKVTTGAGLVNHIETYVGNDTVTVGTGGAGSIYTGADNDTVNLVKGFADFVDTGDGNDMVTVGKAGGHFIMLKDGNDTASITAIGASEGLLVDGGEGGIDTIDLSRFTQGLTVSLNQSGNFQEFAVGTGFFLLYDFENAIGTAKNDNLTGSDAANTLSGGKGADTLTGGLGLDTFVFVVGDGNDSVTDFTLGEDHLSISAAHKLADIAFAKSGADVMLIVGAQHILIENMTVADMRDAGNFVF